MVGKNEAALLAEAMVREALAGGAALTVMS